MMYRLYWDTGDELQGLEMDDRPLGMNYRLLGTICKLLGINYSLLGMIYKPRNSTWDELQATQ